jgi:hypothetical protein
MTDVIRTSWIWLTVGWIGLAAASTVKAQVAAGPDVTPFKAVCQDEAAVALAQIIARWPLRIPDSPENEEMTHDPRPANL